MQRALGTFLIVLSLSATASAQEVLVTGEGVVRANGRETRFHLLIAGDAASLSVESGPCDRGTCRIERHWLFEGPLASGPSPLIAHFMHVQSRAASSAMYSPVEARQAQLTCLPRSPGILRCRLTGSLPRDWGRVPRAFDLRPRGM